MWQLDKSIIGKKFCSLTVLDDYILISKNGCRGTKTKWLVRCDCGNEFYIYRESLLKRKVQYCPNCKPIARRNTRLYHIYYGIKQRCFNPNNSRYKEYGGRGITMCNEWLNSYENFKTWSFEHGYMENCGLSIDRIDNDGDYNPDNCQWITISENASKGNMGKQKNSSKLEFIYAISPSGERVDIKNISKFSREHNLNNSGVSASIHGYI